MAISSWRGVTSPAAATRTGPVRSGVSAPLRKSDRSFERLAVIWSSSATARQPSAVSRRNGVPTASAAPSPTTTPLSAAGSVAGRMASSQIRNVDGRVVGGRHGRRGNREKSGLRFSRKAVEPSCASSVV